MFQRLFNVRALVAVCIAGQMSVYAAQADIDVISNTVYTETEVIGGGGATPFSLGPVIQVGTSPLGSHVVNNLATGVQPAKNGAGQVDGSGSGTANVDGTSEVQTVTSTIAGNLSTLAQFTAAPALGSGYGEAKGMVEIVFIPTADTDFTLFAELTPAVGPLAGTDVFSIRRTDVIGNPIVSLSPGLALINNALPNPISGATGTFLSGAEYTIKLNLSDITSGGAAQSPGDEQTTGEFRLIFEQGTVITPEPTAAALITIGSLALLRRRR